LPLAAITLSALVERAVVEVMALPGRYQGTPNTADDDRRRRRGRVGWD
jgi:hypothetical protein